jgi:ABC-2 type transport system permease protein
MVIYVSAFYTINSQGTRTMAAIGGEFLAGAIIPIPFFPDHIRRIMELTPFGSMQNTPLLIFAGVTQGRDIVVSIALQVFWIVALVAVGRLIMGHALRRVITQGG